MSTLSLLSVIFLLYNNLLINNISEPTASNLASTLNSDEFIFRLADTLKYPPCNEDKIPHYNAYKVSKAPVIDGKLDELEWKNAPRSSNFRDMVSGEETIHSTKAALLWDDKYLYVAYWIEEPNLQATLTKRNALIYTNNDVELFIAGKDTYYEFEINSFGTIYEVFFIWEESYKTGGYDTMEEFSSNQPGRKLFYGVDYKPHPRGARIGYWNWDLKGLKSAVFLDGTINNDKDRDRGWTVELALPWAGMSALARGDNRSLPPENKDVWRMDFSRFNQYKEAQSANDCGGWVWRQHGVFDSHVPECFTFIHFSSDDVNSLKE